MASGSNSLNCVHTTWKIPNLYDHLQRSPTLGSRNVNYLGRDGYGSSHRFLIGAQSSQRQVQLKATLTLDQYENVILSISLDGAQTTSCVTVRVHSIKIIVGYQELRTPSGSNGYSGGNQRVSSEPDSGEIDLSKNECNVNTRYTLASIRNASHGAAEIHFVVCNKITRRQQGPATNPHLPGFVPSEGYLGIFDDCDDIDYNVELMTSLMHESKTGRKSEAIRVNLEQFTVQTLNDFETMLNDETTADIQIKLTLGKEKTFQSHKFILTARSPVFRAMFASQMKEAKENLVVINDISAQTMEHFLSFLYCGSFQDESWIKSLPNLTYVAQKYEVNALKELCNLHLIKSVTCQNAVALANLAECYELTNALAQIRNFIKKNSDSVNFDFAKAAEGLEIGN